MRRGGVTRRWHASRGGGGGQKNYFLTNSERAEQSKEVEIQTTIEPIQQNTIQQPSIYGSNQVAESTICLMDIVGIKSNFQKVNTPKELKETIEGKSNKAKLVFENGEVKKYVLEEKEYYLPANPISTNKCYVK